MLRLSCSTYSSIGFMVCVHFVWLLLLTTAFEATAKPTNNNLPAMMDASTPMPSTKKYTHIISYLNATRKPELRQEFDSDRNEVEATNSARVQQLFGNLLLLQGPGRNSLDTDDAPITNRNTLDDELSMDDLVDEQHESSTETPDAWNRIKLAIPVLEPVRHLIRTVGGGGVNDTHVRNNSHRLVGHSGVHHNNSSPAIETEEDREEAIESTGFDVLEILGTAGTVLVGLLQNVRKLFVASAGNASTAFSGGGGGGAPAVGAN